MKIYTEETVREAIKLARVNNFGDDFKRWISHSEPDIISKLTPIELPSDEEIEKEAKKYTESTPDNDPIRIMTFIQSAKWVIEQIKQQDNGTI